MIYILKCLFKWMKHGFQNRLSRSQLRLRTYQFGLQTESPLVKENQTPHFQQNVVFNFPY